MGEIKDILLNAGAVAGFAALIGLAVLAMLYFSQARDVRRLREWAGREPERAAEIELRAQQLASQAIAQIYEQMGESTSSAPVESTAPPSAPPPPPPPEQDLSGQTQAHDVVAEEFGGEEVGAETSGAETSDAESSGAATAEPAAEAAAVIPPLEPLAEDAPAQTGTPEQTVVAESAGADQSESVSAPATGAESENRLTPSTPAAARAAGPLPPLPPLDTSEFTAVRTPSSSSIPDYYLNPENTGSGHFEPVEPETGHRSRVPFAVAGVLVGVFLVILIATQIFGGNDDATTAQGTGGSATNKPAKPATGNQRINRAAVTVSVLNGTNTEGLAATVADGLQKSGFTDTTTGNLSTGGPYPNTIVYYGPTDGAKEQAQEVAKELVVKEVKPATDELLAQGGSVPVIVVLGADYQQ